MNHWLPVFDTQKIHFRWSICFKALGLADVGKRKSSVKSQNHPSSGCRDCKVFTCHKLFLSPEKLHVLMSKRPLLADIKWIKGQLYFSIVSCQNKSYLWLVMMFYWAMHWSSVVYLPYVAVLASHCWLVIFLTVK